MALTRGWNNLYELYASRLAARRIAVRWQSRHAAMAWRTWREFAAYRRSAAALFADARMLPGAEFLKRWRHQRAVSARYRETLAAATVWFAKTNMRVALKCFKRCTAATQASRDYARITSRRSFLFEPLAHTRTRTRTRTRRFL